MKLIDEALLAEFRTPGRCEFCRKWCEVREPAHIFSRGAGRVDIKENLVSLGSTPNFSCECHYKNHFGGVPTREMLLVVAAAREGTKPDKIRELVYRIRADKSCKVKKIS